MNLQLFKKQEKILLFGGSFDPIHNGHIKILQQAIKTIKPSKILIIPSFISPMKEISNITVQDKINMIRLATKDIDNLEIIDYELKRQKKTFFIETLSYIKMNFLDSKKYILLIGEDQLHNFKNWKEYDKIIDQIYKIYVYKRKHNNDNKCQFCLSFLKNHKKIKYLKNMNFIDISSSRIREEYVLETDLNKNVLDYINQNGLYALNRIKKYCIDKRVSHSLSVAYYAKELMNKYDESLSNKAFVAGVYHDIAKNLSQEEQVKIANEIGIKDYPSWKVLHSYIGSHFLISKYLFEDKEILNAISRHTLPFLYFDSKPNLLDKILYVADKLEPNRTDKDVFDNVPISYFRELAKINIDKCFDELYINLQKGLK